MSLPVQHLWLIPALPLLAAAIGSLTPRGGTFEAQSTVFLEGNPLNVTGLDVGPDGWLYFCTGGRGTEGGIYRVVWMGRVPPEATRLGVGLTAALKQPQLYSAHSR